MISKVQFVVPGISLGQMGLSDCRLLISLELLSLIVLFCKEDFRLASASNHLDCIPQGGTKV